MLIQTLKRLFILCFSHISALGTLLAVAGYAAITWALLYWAGEDALTSFPDYPYWLVVTASTVGYGDLSPTTAAGKWIVVLWAIPVGLSLFALVVAKAGFFLSDVTFRGKRGLRMLKHTNHIVIIGWNGARTLRLIELLLARTNQQQTDQAIVLCVSEEMENPLPSRIGFVRAEAYTHRETMKRANLAEAASIIIDTESDDITVTTALFCAEVSPDAHKTAYFKDETLAGLLKTHCPRVEVIPSVAVEMLAKSTVDPGSSLLHKQLLDATDGMTQFSIPYQGAPQSLEHLFLRFKEQLGATLIGVRHQGSGELKLNPPLNETLTEGDTLYYIAAKRLTPAQCFNH